MIAQHLLQNLVPACNGDMQGLRLQSAVHSTIIIQQQASEASAWDGISPRHPGCKLHSINLSVRYRVIMTRNTNMQGCKEATAFCSFAWQCIPACAVCLELPEGCLGVFCGLLVEGGHPDIGQLARSFSRADCVTHRSTHLGGHWLQCNALPCQLDHT